MFVFQIRQFYFQVVDLLLDFDRVGLLLSEVSDGNILL